MSARWVLGLIVLVGLGVGLLAGVLWRGRPGWVEDAVLLVILAGIVFLVVGRVTRRRS